MNIYAINRLMDIATRQAVFIEQVKLGETEIFNKVLSEISEEFRKHMDSVRYDTLDQLSKAEMTKLLRALRVSQTNVYSRYQAELIKRLEQFMGVVFTQSIRSFASVKSYAQDLEEDSYEEKPVLFTKQKAVAFAVANAKKEKLTPLFGWLVLSSSASAAGTLWRKAVNSPMPSSGAMPLEAINTALAAGMINLENLVRQGAANRARPRDVVQAVTTGTSMQSSFVRRQGNALRAIVGTAMQHLSQSANAAVQSALFARYVWASVMDDRTTPICQSRDGKVYGYGEGPLPPAHTGCRSTVCPYEYYSPSYKPPTFYEWLKVQPNSFIAAVFGDTIARKFADGSIRASDIDGLKISKSLTIADLENKTSDLI